MPHRTCHTEVSNKERNVKTHDLDDGGQVARPLRIPVTADWFWVSACNWMLFDTGLRVDHLIWHCRHHHKTGRGEWS